jgi:hypothetical protein
MTNMPADAFLVVMLIVAAVAALASLVNQKQRALNHKRHFGPEYDHAAFKMLRYKRNANPRRVESVNRNRYADRVS